MPQLGSFEFGFGEFGAPAPGTGPGWQVNAEPTLFWQGTGSGAPPPQFGGSQLGGFELGFGELGGGPLPSVTPGWGVKAEPTVIWPGGNEPARWAVLAKPTVRWQSDRAPGWEVDAEPQVAWVPAAYVTGFAVTLGTPVSWTAVSGSDVTFQVREKPIVTWIVEDIKPTDCVSGDGLGPGTGLVVKNYVF